MTSPTNPELRRNLWLEVTAQRLLAMPAILLLVFTASWLLDRHAFGFWMRGTALAAYFVVTAIWGARLSSATLTTELAQGTWDSQRGSGLSAWSMTWGKLLGGAAIAWYGGLLCLLVYIMSALVPLGPARLGWILLLALALGLAVQAAALAVALLRWRKHRQPQAHSSRALLSIALIVLLLFVGIHDLPELANGRLGALRWYGSDWPGLPFAAISATLFAGWATLGAWRLMRAELQYRDVPWVWVAFLLFLTAYLGGWAHAPGAFPRIDFPGLRLPPTLPVLGLGGLLCAAATYLMIFLEAKDWLRLRRLATRWRHERHHALHDLPLWLVSLTLTMAFVIAVCVTGLSSLPRHDGTALAAGSIALLYFLLRDVLLVLWLNGGTPPSRRADAAAFVYLIVLYLLLPSLLMSARLGHLDGLFNPLVAFVQPAWAIAGIAEAIAVAGLLWWRRSRPRAQPVPGGT